MNFAADRDLLALEPGVFHDAPFAAQQRLHVTDATVAGVTLTSTAADFVGAQVDAGSVILVAGTPHEVVGRADANTLTVSLPRASTDQTPIPGRQGANLETYARTFEPQTTLVHESLLRLLGVDRDDPDHPLDETAILSHAAMVRLEALGTLERVYASAIALTGDHGTLLLKANSYRARFDDARQRANVLIDLDGDGRADERRTLNTVRLQRV